MTAVVDAFPAGTAIVLSGTSPYGYRNTEGTIIQNCTLTLSSEGAFVGATLGPSGSWQGDAGSQTAYTNPPSGSSIRFVFPANVRTVRLFIALANGFPARGSCTFVHWARAVLGAL